MKWIALCLLLMLCGCSKHPMYQNDKINQKVNFKERILSADAIQAENNHHQDKPEEKRTLEDLVKDAFDLQTVDLFRDLCQQSYDSLTFQLTMSDRYIESTVTDQAKINEFFTLLSEMEPTYINSYFPGFDDHGKYMHVDMQLFSPVKGEIKCRYAFGLGFPSFIMWDEHNTEYYISFNINSQSAFEEYFEFMNLGVSARGPSGVGKYEEQFVEARQSTPFLINRDEIYPALNDGGDRIITQFTDVSHPLYSALFKAFYDSNTARFDPLNWQFLVMDQKEEEGMLVLNALAFYTSSFTFEDHEYSMIYDANWRPLKRSDFNYYEGISYGEALNSVKDRFHLLTIKLQLIDNEYILTEALIDLAEPEIERLDPALPIVNVFQSNGIYDGKYTYPSNLNQAIPQFNLTGSLAYQINQQIQALRGNVIAISCLKMKVKSL